MAWATKPYRDCVKLQQLIMRDAEIADLKPIIRAGIARAFCELEETKRKLKMKPLPKPIDVSPHAKRRRKDDEATFEPAAPNY